MKFFVRAFVLSLVVTGAFASTQINNSSVATLSGSKISAVPVPVCPPDDPNGCGLLGTIR